MWPLNLSSLINNRDKRVTVQPGAATQRQSGLDHKPLRPKGHASAQRRPAAHQAINDGIAEQRASCCCVLHDRRNLDDVRCDHFDTFARNIGPMRSTTVGRKLPVGYAAGMDMRITRLERKTHCIRHPGKCFGLAWVIAVPATRICMAEERR